MPAYTSEADFVAKMMETTNAIFGIFEVVKLDKAKTRNRSIKAGQAALALRLTPCKERSCGQWWIWNLQCLQNENPIQIA